MLLQLFAARKWGQKLSQMWLVSKCQLQSTANDLHKCLANCLEPAWNTFQTLVAFEKLKKQIASGMLICHGDSSLTGLIIAALGLCEWHCDPGQSYHNLAPVISLASDLSNSRVEVKKIIQGELRVDPENLFLPLPKIKNMEALNEIHRQQISGWTKGSASLVMRLKGTSIFRGRKSSE